MFPHQLCTISNITYQLFLKLKSRINNFIHLYFLLLKFSEMLKIYLPSWLSYESSVRQLSGQYCQNLSSKETLSNSKKDAASNLEAVLVSQSVPATCISFRPNNKTDYVIGTVSGNVLLVSMHIHASLKHIMQRICILLIKDTRHLFLIINSFLK